MLERLQGWLRPFEEKKWQTLVGRDMTIWHEVALCWCSIKVLIRLVKAWGLLWDSSPHFVPILPRSAAR